MATHTYKVLGQAVPGATLTDLYTVPAGKSAVVSKLVVCNKAAAAKTFRVKVAPLGAADTDAHNLYYDTTIPANETLELLQGLAIAATDKVRVYANDTNVSFTISGDEVG